MRAPSPTGCVGPRASRWTSRTYRCPGAARTARRRLRSVDREHPRSRGRLDLGIVKGSLARGPHAGSAAGTCGGLPSDMKGSAVRLVRAPSRLASPVAPALAIALLVLAVAPSIASASEVITHGSRTKPQVALTFDDGWSAS